MTEMTKYPRGLLWTWDPAAVRANLEALETDIREMLAQGASESDRYIMDWRDSADDLRRRLAELEG